MDYAQIERFLTIVKHMNLGKAAGELYISQSALSQSISNLEKELGFSLFHRISNKLVLTRRRRRFFPILKRSIRPISPLKSARNRCYRRKHSTM